MPKKNDIVYVLKKNMDPEELRYSLRSVEKNFPHGRVWFVGACPEGFKPDVFIEHEQSGANKWERIRSSLWKVVMTDDLTDDFFWFNDDFFVMKKVKGKFINFTEKTLMWRVEQLTKKDRWTFPYECTLYKEAQELRSLGYGELNFEVHIPMLLNKDLVKTSIGQISSPQLRSAYGNINRIPYVDRDDCKVYDLDTVPDDPDYLSTTERTFAEGKVGEYIRGCFPEPSRFEVDT